MVPGAEARGLVAPRMTEVVRTGSRTKLLEYIPRPVLTTSLPSQTIAQMGPEDMSIKS